MSVYPDMCRHACGLPARDYQSSCPYRFRMDTAINPHAYQQKNSRLRADLPSAARGTEGLKGARGRQKYPQLIFRSCFTAALFSSWK